MKVLHLLHRSLPGMSGYTIRSKHIVEFQKLLGLEPVVITSPFQKSTTPTNGVPEYINSIPYYRTDIFSKLASMQVRSSSLWISALKFPLVLTFAKQALDIAKRIQPEIVHAHSPFYCGIVASVVSKELNIPCLYEVRGVWEGSSASTEVSEASVPQKAMRFLENRAMRRNDAVVVISRHLEKELSARGVNNKTYIVPNGVDTNQFTSSDKSRQLLKELHLDDRIVLGYIGTLSADYEGLEYLIRALPEVISSHPRVALLLVGDGRLREDLRQLSEEIGVGANVVFTGSIPHEKVPEYYSVIDISIFPRKRTLETEQVTALKPVEAMASGTAVIASNVGAMKELVSDGKTGILFEAEDVQDLANKCIELIADKKKRSTLARRGKQWARENRDWTGIVAEYRKIYESLCGRSSQKVRNYELRSDDRRKAQGGRHRA